MITARVEFLQNKVLTKLSEPPMKLHERLQSIGVLTPQDMILLDNSRTLRVHLYPDNYNGEQLLKLVDRKADSLGTVNKLCYSINRMDSRDRDKFFKNISEGRYYTLSEAQHDVSKMKEHRRMRNRRKERSFEL